MNKRQAGFGAVEVILIVLVVGLLGFIAVQYIGNRDRQNGDSSQQDQSNNSESKKVANKEYKNTLAGFTVKYPETWKLETSNSEQGGSEYPTTSTTITSPNKNVLNLNVGYGGKGGGCFPKTSDIPHASGNECNTEEFLSKEKINATASYTDDQGTKEYPVYLVAKKFTGIDDKTVYIIGLETEYGVPLELNKPHMGFYLSNMEFYSGKYHIYAYAQGSSPDFLNSEDGEAIKTTLRSFSLN
jgi:Tfp pilus assembly protein PilE